MTDNPLRNEDFEAIEAAVMETARGRWFLAEHARRQRLAETVGVFDAITSLEERLTSRLSVPEPSPATPDMSAISGLIDEAYEHVLTAFGVTKTKASDAATPPSRAEAARLAAETLRDLRNRMQALAGGVEAPAPENVPSQEEPAADVSVEVAESEAAAPADTEETAEVPAAVPADPVVEEELFGETDEPEVPVETVPEPRQLDNHEHLATTLRAAIAQVRGPSSDIDSLSFEAKSVLFA